MILLEDGHEIYLIEAFSRNELLDMLSSGTAVISFKKRTNNRYRLMYATRKMDLIPPNHHPSGEGLKFDPEEKGLIPVFDLVKKKWRSFAVKNVSGAAQKSLGWLSRLLRRRKYTADYASPQRESVEDGFMIEAFEVASEPLAQGPLKEMVAGPVGKGSDASTTTKGFIDGFADTIEALRGTEIEYLPSEGGLTIVQIGDWVFGLDTGMLKNKGTHDTLELFDTTASWLFYGELHSADVENFRNGRKNRSVYSPYTHPDHVGKSIASSVYKSLVQKYNLVASNNQTIGGRGLWYKLVRNHTLPYVYVWDNGLKSEISGDGDEFIRVMRTAPKSTLIIATSKKVS